MFKKFLTGPEVDRMVARVEHGIMTKREALAVETLTDEEKRVIAERLADYGDDE